MRAIFPQIYMQLQLQFIANDTNILPQCDFVVDEVIILKKLCILQYQKIFYGPKFIP